MASCGKPPFVNWEGQKINFEKMRVWHHKCGIRNLSRKKSKEKNKLFFVVNSDLYPDTRFQIWRDLIFMIGCSPLWDRC